MHTTTREYLNAKGVPGLVAVYRKIASQVGFAPFKAVRVGVELTEVWALVGLGLASEYDFDRNWFRLHADPTLELEVPGTTATGRRARLS